MPAISRHAIGETDVKTIRFRGQIVWQKPSDVPSVPVEFGWAATDRVQTTATIPKCNVRSSREISALSLLYQIAYKAEAGTIVDGPIYNVDNGFWWYQVDFDNPAIPTGWIGADTLEDEVIIANDAPTATGQSVTTEFDTAVAITLAASDPNSDPLSYTVVDSPTRGALTGTAPNLTYTPTAGQSGEDFFTFKTNDGTADSNVATVVVTIEPETPANLVASPVVRSGWVVTATTARPAYPVANMVDGSLSTIYASDWDDISLPLEIIVDTGSVRELVEFKVTPRQDQYYPSGSLRDFTLHASVDGVAYSQVASGSGFISQSPLVIGFAQTTARFLKLVAPLSSSNNHVVIADIQATEMVPDVTPPGVDPPTPPPTTPGDTTMLSSVTKDGITWTFSEAKPCGQYCNGDWFVVGPVTITSISPECVTDGAGWTRNGTEVNPVPAYIGGPSGYPQGFDSSMNGFLGIYYNGAANVAPSKTGSPLVVTTGSVVSTKSRDSAGTSATRPQITDAAVLTVVSSAPAAGAFRPPVIGTDKVSYFNESQLDYGILRSLTPPSSAPGISAITSSFSRHWFTHMEGSPARYIAPLNAMPQYGRDQAYLIGEAMLSLHLNHTNSAKRDLFVSLVQMGIDTYAGVQAGMLWVDYGGINAGRKGPLFLAAMALNNAGMKEWTDASQHNVFHDDRQCWIVSQFDVDRSAPVGADPNGELRPTNAYPEPLPYLPEHIGMPEWGSQHLKNRIWDNQRWTSCPYRDVNGGPLVAMALAARMVPGGRAAWGWEPFFLYHERYWSIEGAGTFSQQNFSANGIHQFSFDMLKTYNSSY